MIVKEQHINKLLCEALPISAQHFILSFIHLNITNTGKLKKNSVKTLQYWRISIGHCGIHPFTNYVVYLTIHSLNINLL